MQNKNALCEESCPKKQEKEQKPKKFLGVKFTRPKNFIFRTQK